ncbi:2-(1,2-epoxy-1,2-dihydrophenyl)acetyl-CoA isomerase [Salinihabitans flavidus]|uniref:2-(1,2-epoxy-1,2-dihydrophenyl)acetyl-CoA isomerase n=1 Tax=Salinihabitans flavidus TaxID=569882 RepID=A0A1H8V7V1_9RHOB|nr:enoyl-CoA hydratase-related protein [Salinihabitans flavidus]SEP11431.1 2-(1,2-epoxy-1,2-dihydrophenyl)acetyl-CoA isomerase [Salinihabitans flavidus]
MLQDVAIEVSGGIARLTINRPDKLNAMRDQTADELKQGLSEVEDDPSVRAVILTGAGRGFGAGYDLPAIDMSRTPELDTVLDAHFNPLVRKMRQSRLPIIAAVNGPCAGASVGVALAADIVLAGRSAFFYEPFIGLGLVPDAGNTIFMTRLAGRIRASGAMLLGDRITAQEAERWGLVWRVTEDEALLDEAGAIAESLAARAPASVAATKRLITAASESDLSAMLDGESLEQGILGRTDEMRSAIERFVASKKAG